MCGGTCIGIDTADCPATWGLSPRVRGNQNARSSGQTEAYRVGLSPRVRGNPLCSHRVVYRIHQKVYPRVCGGTNGRGDVRIGVWPVVRSIPACAGEPGVCNALFCRDRVYPRVCGGTGSSRARPLQNPGLSPRVRGNPADLSTRAAMPPNEGLSPRVRGNRLTLVRRESNVITAVYPRVCGGTSASPLCLKKKSAQPSGLSPRVRGNHQFRSQPVQNK